MWDLIKQYGLSPIVKYGIVGLVNTGVDFLMFSLLLQLGWSPSVANVLGFLAGSVNSYILNTIFTFRMSGVVSATLHVKRALSFAVVTLLCIAVSALTFSAFQPFLSPYSCKVLSTIAVLAFGYIMNKTFVFRTA